MQVEGSRTVYTVYMGEQIGYVGGQVGAALGNPVAYHLQLVIEGANEVITAFPYIPTP
jgi:ABC-type lipoprotein release transport system permease subunit